MAVEWTVASEREGSRWRDVSATQAVMNALGAEAGLARFVGGCVRNTLLQLPITDIDIATIHTPEETTKRLLAAGLKAEPTGIAHGTITAIADHHPYEITTLRRDMETDGRHAVVAFTDDWAEDAARRDFTMNAIFMDIDGVILDPIGGMEDALAGRVRFVGEATQRIREDALRILRFFRFQAQYGKGRLDAGALAACRLDAASLNGLSGERIRNELLKLLAAPATGLVVRAMAEAGILYALFPNPLRVDALDRLITQEGDQPSLLRRLAVLLDHPPEAVAQRLRLSKTEGIRLSTMMTDRLDLDADEAGLKVQLHRYGVKRFVDLAWITAALEDSDPALFRRSLALSQNWKVPTFPLRGADLIKLGLVPDQQIGRILAMVETRWLDGGFQADREVCLAWTRDSLTQELEQDMANIAETAARALTNARANNQPIQSFPDGSVPSSVEAAYAIQDAAVALSGEEVSAWKVGPAASGFPETCAPILASRVLSSPVALSNALRLKAVECEVAFRLARDLPPAGGPYTSAQARDAVATAMVAIEVVETRYTGWPVEDRIWALADNQSNHALVVGTETPLPDATTIGALTATLALGEAVKPADKGFPGGDPFALIAWLATHVGTRSPALAARGLKAGDIITTGSWNGVDFAADDMTVHADYPGLGSAEVTYG